MKEKEALKEYLNLQTCSEKRIAKIKNILVKSRKIIGKDLTKLEITDITKFLKYLNNSDYAQYTKNDYKKIFKSFLKWNYRNTSYMDWFDNRNVVDGFKGVSKKTAFNQSKINKDTLLKPEELEKLLRSAKTLKWKAILTLLYESGFRPCELVNLKWKDLNFIDGKGICSVRTCSPKTKETRTIPVKDCIVHLKRWREEYSFPNLTNEDYVFPNPVNRNKHIAEGSLGTVLKRLCATAGIRPIYPYIFRHSRIYFIQKELGIILGAEFGGHSIETAEASYGLIDCDDVEEAMLNKIYTTEEITPEEKVEVKKLQQEVKNLSKLVKNLSEFSILSIKNKNLFDKGDFEELRRLATELSGQKIELV